MGGGEEVVDLHLTQSKVFLKLLILAEHQHGAANLYSQHLGGGGRRIKGSKPSWTTHQV